MGKTGMTPYYFLYLAVALLFLLWLALVVVTVTAGQYRRDKKSRQLFHDEKMFFHNRNFLSWLLARNPVKSILLKAVRSGKKQGNVCKSYIIPAPLLYQYSYIKDILFYFFYFLSQPVKLSCCIHFLSDVRNFMSDHILDGVFIDAIFFCHAHEMFSSVMWPMVRIQLQFITDSCKSLLIPVVCELYIFPVAIWISAVEKVFAPKSFCLFIFSENQRLYP